MFSRLSSFLQRYLYGVPSVKVRLPASCPFELGSLVSLVSRIICPNPFESELTVLHATLWVRIIYLWSELDYVGLLWSGTAFSNSFWHRFADLALPLIQAAVILLLFHLWLLLLTSFNLELSMLDSSNSRSSSLSHSNPNSGVRGFCNTKLSLLRYLFDLKLFIPDLFHWSFLNRTGRLAATNILLS